MSVEIITWFDSDGNPHSLSDFPFFGMLRGRQNAFMPPARHIEDRVPMQNGARFRNSFFEPRSVDLPFHVEDTDEDVLRAHLRNIMGWFNPYNGDGQLEIAHGSTVRRLNCRYQDGLGLDESDQNNGVYWQDFVLTLRAADPFWYDVTPTHVDYAAAGGGTLYFFPILPMQLITSAVFGTSDIVNSGDVEAWPVWTIDGPTSGGLVLTNNTSGLTFELSGLVLTLGQTLTIDTRPGHKTIKRDDGSNRMGDGFSGSMWPLVRGTNNLTVNLGGSDTNSRVQLDYHQGYLAP